MSDRIFEIGGAGLESTDERVKKLMDNLVNSEVPGYKKSEAVIRGFPLELHDALNKYSLTVPQVEGSAYDNLQGALIKTDGKLDIALNGSGYFVLAGPWGEGYTRDGRFRLDKDGRLLSVAGNLPLMGKGGPIVVTPGSDVEIDQEGEVKVDKAAVDTIRVVIPEQKDSLEPQTGSIFKKKDAKAVLQEIDHPRIIQGYIEASNVNVIDQLVEMMFLERIFNTDTKVLSTRDANLAKAMEMARPTQ